MPRILKIGLLTLMQKTNGLVGLTVTNKLDLMYNIFSNNYDPKVIPPCGKNREHRKGFCNQKSGKEIQRIA